jgi:hypothetical protein
MKSILGRGIRFRIILRPVIEEIGKFKLSAGFWVFSYFSTHGTQRGEKNGEVRAVEGGYNRNCDFDHTHCLRRCSRAFSVADTASI